MSRASAPRVAGVVGGERSVARQSSSIPNVSTCRTAGSSSGLASGGVGGPSMRRPPFSSSAGSGGPGPLPTMSPCSSAGLEGPSSATRSQCAISLWTSLTLASEVRADLVRVGRVLEPVDACAALRSCASGGAPCLLPLDVLMDVVEACSLWDPDCGESTNRCPGEGRSRSSAGRGGTTALLVVADELTLPLWFPSPASTPG